MKKIFSLLLVACMLFASVAVVNAAGTCSVYFTTETPVVKVGDTFDVTLYVELAGGANFSGGNIYVDYDNTVATITAINVGELTASASTPANPTTGFANWTLANRPTTSGSYMVVTFEAIAAADEFVVGAKSTTFRTSGTPAINKDNIGKATIKIEGDEFVPETIEGTEVAAAATDIELDKDPATSYKNQYVGTAVFNATLGADVKYGEAGFIWVKDGVKTANKFAVDAKAITGNGTFDYGVAMYAIPAGVTITAIPYYVTAE